MSAQDSEKESPPCPEEKPLETLYRYHGTRPGPAPTSEEFRAMVNEALLEMGAPSLDEPATRPEDRARILAERAREAKPE